MDRARFEEIVAVVLANLPPQFRHRLENVDVVIEDRPSLRQLARAKIRPGHMLLGLYEGVPLTRRGRSYGLVLPDKITLFQKPIESIVRFGQGIEYEIEKVLRHEIAHHFGISDERLETLSRPDND